MLVIIKIHIFPINETFFFLFGLKFILEKIFKNINKLNFYFSEICNNAIIKIEPNNAEISNESSIQKTTAKPWMNIANKPVKSSKAVRVAGFDFPLTCEEDVDRLELMVNRNPFIKSQYVSLAISQSPNH